MKLLADVSVVPIGIGVSMAKYIAACERVFRDAGLEPKLHAFGTNVEGEWDAVMGAIRRCHETVHEMGAPRVHTSIRCGTRTDRDDSLEDRVRRVEEQT